MSIIRILPTDKIFDDSPDTGTKDCICSRCLNLIGENEAPLRCWETDENDITLEWRYCEACQEKEGIHIYKDNYNQYPEL